MKLKLLLLIAVILSISMPSSAQLPLPTRTIGGTQFYYHEVQKKETLYSIAKKLGIDKSDIIKYNPNAAEKIKEGQFLFFPVSDFANLSNKATTQNAQADASTTAPTSFDHIVEKGETLYGIAKNYGVSTNDIIKLNSNANSGIKEGQTLKIPQNAAMQQGQEIAAATETEVTPEDTTLIYVTIRPGDTLFSTAKRYNTSIDKLMELNPGISPQNFKSGEVIRVRPNYYTTITTERETTEFHTYEIKRGDTYFSIARNFNVSVNDLKAANPDMKKLKRGKTLYIPIKKTETVVVDNADNVPVRQESLSVVNGAGLKSYSVIVGSFSVQANAEGMQSTLRSQGYDAQVAYNAGNQMYRVVAATFDTKPDAVRSRNELRSQYPDAWLLYNQK